jgi:hypothetical protein
MKVFLRSFLVTVVFISGCKDPFDPKLPFAESNFLVVEGYINVGENAVTIIRLSRTTEIKEGRVKPNPEREASISILDDIGETYPVIERGNGSYSTDSLFLALDRSYRLKIVTANGKEYYSEFTTPVQSPAIDSVHWKLEPDGVVISVSTHDPLDQTKYYQWDYEEVWEIESPFLSVYKVSGGQYVMREYDEIQEMRKCWKKGFPKGIMMTSTASFVPNAPITKPLILIPLAHDKLSERYSVLIKQHALSKEGYEYLRIMEKNTTQVGSFFDPQPSQLHSNISAIDSSEPVIGYIGAYTTSQVRLFIYHQEQLPDWEWDLGCGAIGVTNHPDSIAKYHLQRGYVPITFVDAGHTFMTATTPVCNDCRLRGGAAANKPDFWD